MLRLIIVRHAKTVWNITHRLQGVSDIPLCDEGIAAAKEAAAQFDGVKVDRVFSSPLVRARATAELMLGMPYECDDRLAERNFGSLDGTLADDLTPEQHHNLFYGMDGVPEAEDAASLFARTRSFLDNMKARFDGKTVAVFSHCICISFLLHAAAHDVWNGGEYEMRYVKNCSLTEVTL